MRIAVFVLAVLGALACGGLGWKYKSDERTGEPFRQIRQIERDLARAGGDEQQALLEMGILPSSYVAQRDEYRWVLRLCYAMLAALPLGMLGGLLALHRKGWAAGLVLLLAAAGPLVCASQLSSGHRDPWVMAVPTGPLMLAGLLSFFIRARPAAALLAVVCPTCATALKYTPLSGPAQIGCPRCKTVMAVPAASPAQAAQVAKPKPEAPPTEPKKRPRRRSTSPVATILGWVLAVGGATAFSVLAALDVISLAPSGPEEDRPLAHQVNRPKDGPERPPDQPPDQRPEPAPEPQDEARWAAQREQQLRQQQEREKPLIEPLRQLPVPKPDWAEPALLTLATFAVPGASIDDVAFAPDGETVAAADEKTIWLWDLRTGKVKHTLRGGGTDVSQIAFSPDGQVLAAAEQKAVRLWDARTGTVRHVLTGTPGWGPSIVFDRAGRLLTGGLADGGGGEIRVWDVATGKPVATLAAQPDPVLRLTRSPRHSHLAFAAGFAKQVVLADGQSGEARQAIKASNVMALAFSPDGKALAVVGGDFVKPTVTLYEVSTGKPLHTLTGPSKPRAPLAFSPDGTTLVTNGSSGLDGTFTLWDAATGKLKQTVEKGHGRALKALAFSPGGALLVTAGDAHVNLWSVADLSDGGVVAAVAAIQPFAIVRRKGTGLHVVPSERLGDEELARLKALPRLTGLVLNVHSEVTDAGLAHLAGMTHLEELVVSSKNPITDAGLAHLKNLKRLTVLGVTDFEGVTDAGLAHLSGLTALKELNLALTSVTSAGLVHLKGMTALERLDLSGTNINDAALDHLAGLKKLTDINLANTDVSKEAVEKLKKALPEARIKTE